jgi:segregation and condensation protein A
VVFEQLTPLGELHVRWTGPVTGDDDPAAGVDDYDGQVPEAGPDDDEQDDEQDDEEER